jgi:hypothetical protein
MAKKKNSPVGLTQEQKERVAARQAEIADLLVTLEDAFSKEDVKAVLAKIWHLAAQPLLAEPKVTPKPNTAGPFFPGKRSGRDFTPGESW